MHENNTKTTNVDEKEKDINKEEEKISDEVDSDKNNSNKKGIIFLIIAPIKTKRLLSMLLLFTGCSDETLTVLFFSLFLKLIITI